MSMKDFDFKQFMLEKGEWVGTGVAGVLAVSLIVIGTVSAVTSKSPNEVASDITGKATQLRNNTQNMPPKTPYQIPPVLLTRVTHDLVPPQQYALATDFFIQTSLDDNKRRNPDILGPREFQPSLIRGQVQFNDVTMDKDGNLKISIVVAENAPTVLTKPKKKNARQAEVQRALNFAQSPGGGNKGIFANMQPPGGAQGPVRSPNPGMLGESGNTATRNKIVPVPLDAIDTTTRLAVIVNPVRMLMVSASFPFKDQLESFRRALRYRNLTELLKDQESLPNFKGIEVQRRTLRPDGKLVEDWADLDIRESVRWAYYRYVMSRSVGSELDDVRLKPVLVPGLVQPRPKLMSHQRYPSVNLKLISQTLDTLEKQNKSNAKPVENPLRTKLMGNEVELFAGQADDSKPTMPMDGVATESTAKPEGPVVPDYCLMRFFDMTVRAGFVYEYQVRVKVANPNYQKKKELMAYPSLAEIKDLYSPWVKLPNPVEVPRELFFYAVDDRIDVTDKDRTRVQIHYWLDNVRLDPGLNEYYPVGDWTVKDLPTYRGEFVGRTENVDVPMWFPENYRYELAINPKVLRVRLPRGVKPPSGIPVDFSTRGVLVDFEGGEGFYRPSPAAKPTKDECSMEMLVLTGDGKLVVRNSTVDKKDTEREERAKSVTNWVSDVKNGATKGGSGDDPFAPKKKP